MNRTHKKTRRRAGFQPMNDFDRSDDDEKQRTPTKRINSLKAKKQRKAEGVGHRIGKNGEGHPFIKQSPAAPDPYFDNSASHRSHHERSTCRSNNPILLSSSDDEDQTTLAVPPRLSFSSGHQGGASLYVDGGKAQVQTRKRFDILNTYRRESVSPSNGLHLQNVHTPLQTDLSVPEAPQFNSKREKELQDIRSSKITELHAPMSLEEGKILLHVNGKKIRIQRLTVDKNGIHLEVPERDEPILLPKKIISRVDSKPGSTYHLLLKFSQVIKELWNYLRQPPRRNIMMTVQIEDGLLVRKMLDKIKAMDITVTRATNLRIEGSLKSSDIFDTDTRDTSKTSATKLYDKLSKEAVRPHKRNKNDEKFRTPSQRSWNSAPYEYPSPHLRTYSESKKRAKQAAIAVSPRRPSRFQMDPSITENLGSKILSYNGIELLGEDIVRLQPGDMLNDAIIDFYLINLQHTAAQENTLVFNTQFYQLIKRRSEIERYAKTVPSNTDLFDKDFVFIPCNESLHWSLAILCYPGQPKHPNHCILYCDSLYSSPNIRMEYIRDYLQRRHVVERKTEQVFDNDSFPVKMAVLPQQTNYVDCGVYMIHYVEHFVRNEIRQIPVKNPDLFSDLDILSKRQQIYALIKQLLPEYASVAVSKSQMEDTDEDDEVTLLSSERRKSSGSSSAKEGKEVLEDKSSDEETNKKMSPRTRSSPNSVSDTFEFTGSEPPPQIINKKKRKRTSFTAPRRIEESQSESANGDIKDATERDSPQIVTTAASPPQTVAEEKRTASPQITDSPQGKPISDNDQSAASEGGESSSTTSQQTTKKKRKRRRLT